MKKRRYNLPDETKICVVCTNEFGPSRHDYKAKWRKRKTCSRECNVILAAQANRTLTSKICSQCKEPFQPREKTDKFCCKECYWKSKIGAKYGIRPNKWVTITCIQCNKEFSIEKYWIALGRKFCTRPCYIEWVRANPMPAFSHREAPFYISKEWIKLRNKIKKRDNYTCQDCRTIHPKRSNTLVVHHKVFRRTFEGAEMELHPIADHPSNLETLCRGCHGKKHSVTTIAESFWTLSGNFSSSSIE